jgi:acyl-coenzyme A thioesterase PaaI-like protein
MRMGHVTTGETLPGWTRYDEPNAFMLHNGPLWGRIVDGRREYAFRGGDIHGNLNGVVHGGMITTFADHALGHACWMDNGGKGAVTAHLAVSFVSAARLGELVTCRVEIVRKTSALYFPRGDLMVGERVVATATGVWKIIGAR